MTATAHRSARLLLAALTSLALAWLAAPSGSAPPLYDGVGFPDEPYRYVAAPPGAPATSPPGIAAGDAHVVNGTSQVAYASSDEQGPQVEFIVSHGEITAPSGATVVHLRATPVAPTRQPPDATIWGNVYRLTALSDKGPAQVHASGSSATAINLRAPTGPTPTPVMEYSDDGTTWRRLPVARVGNDVYSAPIPGVGDYALATVPDRARPVPGTTSGGIDRWVLVPGTALLILIAAIAAIRWTRSPRRRAARASGATSRRG